jgi:hypothetical protein
MFVRTTNQTQKLTKIAIMALTRGVLFMSANMSRYNMTDRWYSNIILALYNTGRVFMTSNGF